MINSKGCLTQETFKHLNIIYEQYRMLNSPYYILVIITNFLCIKLLFLTFSHMRMTAMQTLLE
jgi:hypothetical protein